MYNYLYTNDMRISDLPNSIKRVSEILLSGMEPYQVDKSFGNNGATIQFYFNLQNNTETLIKGKDATIDVIRNFILKFQFPNTRTLESFKNTLNDKILFAPYRAIISTLYKLALRDGVTSHLTHEEILFFFFCNSDVCTNPNFDVDKLIKRILDYRNAPYDIASIISANIKWNQYERQLREMMTVLQYASGIFKNWAGTLSFVMPTDTGDVEFINSILNYDKIWYPSNIEDFNLSNNEYISYMDTANTPYYVIELNKSQKDSDKIVADSLQRIYYGCPGSGKSFKLKDALVKRGIDEEHQKRVTFHPDTDYASFVGCYKPITTTTQSKPELSKAKLVKLLQEIKDRDESYPVHKFATEYCFALKDLSAADKEEILVSADFTSNYIVEMNKSIATGLYMREKYTSGRISYSFCPQVFTQAYVQAWQNLNENVYLVIEEINRGNCAQIFGDLFQLLDRNNEGYSEYKVTADKDLADYLIGVLGAEHDGIKDGKLCLPPNLIIYATMNTSDQSLFPMDSAFKRRWEWEYVPIDYSENVKSGKFEITIGDKVYGWVKFLEIVNDKIYDATNSEDKQMGNFFIKQSVNAEEFVNKVMFYLWNEVCKEEYGTQRNFFRKGADGKTEFKFTDLFKADKDNTLQEFMSNLGVKPLGNETEE